MTGILTKSPLAFLNILYSVLGNNFLNWNFLIEFQTFPAHSFVLPTNVFFFVIFPFIWELIPSGRVDIDEVCWEILFIILYLF